MKKSKTGLYSDTLQPNVNTDAKFWFNKPDRFRAAFDTVSPTPKKLVSI